MRALFVVGLLAGCTGGPGDQYNYQGYPMNEFFPFDGDRTWTFTNADATLDTTVQASLDPAPVTLTDGRTARNIAYSRECIEDGCTDAGPHTVSAIQWSSEAVYGVQIHEFTGPDGQVSFDPPLT